jgi:hypothetical protein
MFGSLKKDPKMKMKLLLFSLGIVLAAMSTAVQAETITLSAVQDAACGERPTSNRPLNFDGQQLPISNVGTSDRWFSVYQFDLSALPGEITSAHIELYDLGTSSVQNLAFNSDQYIVSPKADATDEQLVVVGVGGANAFDKDGMHETAMSYTAYVAAVNATTGYWRESASVMALTLDANNTAGYYSSANADATMLSTLNDSRTGRGYVVVLGYRGVSGSKRIFDDSEGGHAPRLVVDAVPEPGVWILLSLAGLALATYRHRY